MFKKILEKVRKKRAFSFCALQFLHKKLDVKAQKQYTRAMIKLIASDLDGTLLDENKRIPGEFFTLLPKLSARGIRFVAASGRSLFTLQKNFESVKDQIDFICDNGAVTCCQGAIVAEKALSPSTVAAVIDQSEKLDGVCLLLCTQNSTYRLSLAGSAFNAHINPYYVNQVVVQSLRTVREPVFKIAVCDLKNPAKNGYPQFLEKFGGEATLQISGDVWFDVMQKGVNKGDAIKAIQTYYAIDRAQTMAFGDYYNDIELLAQAEESYVMENANPDMRQYAKHVCGKNTDNAVVNTIYRVLFGE